MTTLSLNWNGSATDTVRRSWAVSGILWTLQILSAGMFLFAGVHKLSGAPDMVQAFGAIGLGQWFRYLTAGIEIVSAILLLVPAAASYGAAALAVTMAGAVMTHLFIIGGTPAPALLMLAFTLTIAWARRK